MLREKRILIMLAILILSMGVLTACQSESPAAPVDNPQEPNEVSSPKAIDGDITVGVSINALDAINNRQVFEMMQKKVTDAGYECIATNANGTAVQQSTDIENLVQQGCNVIVVLNGDTDGLTNAVKEASDKGVHVISVESGYIPGISAYFAKNDFALGAAMYMMLAGEMGYEGEIIATGHNDHPAIRARVNIQEAMLKEYTKIKMVNKVTTGYPGTTELAYNGVESALQQNPDVKSIWCTFDLEAIGAAQACEALGKTDIKIVGADGEIDVLKMIKDEKYIVATSVADLEATTDDVIDTIADLGAGENVKMFHEMPFIMITKDNVDEWIERTESYLKNN
jgi:ABC-type sugar transport system substrate-binding protein